MRVLFLVRHGETDENAQGRTIATTDPSLNSRGAAQADAVARTLSSVDIGLIISSPRRRCVQTAEAIAAAQGTAQGRTPSVQLDTGLVEIGLGAFEGRSVDEIRANGLGEVFAAGRRGSPPESPPGGERFDDASARLGAVFDEACRSDVDSVVLVGHSHALRIMIATRILGGTPEMHRRLFLNHASVTSVFWEGETPRLAVLNGSVASDVLAPPVSRAFGRRHAE